MVGLGQLSTHSGRDRVRPIADIASVGDVSVVHRIDKQHFYLAFTDGWGDEPIVMCEPVAQSTRNPRLVICAVEPPIALKRTVVLYDRFSEGSWLPVREKSQVGVLLGDIDVDTEPEVGELELTFWATVFADLKDAELARKRLRPDAQS